MQMAVIQGTQVVNIIEADESFTLDGFTLVPLVAPGYIGGTFQDGAFSAAPAAPPPPPATTIAKSTVMARVIAANKMAQAQTALWANPDQFARWFAPDQPLVNCDDPDTTAFITELGLDPAEILAP